MSLDRFIRVNRRKPCPVCDHGDWCAISLDGAVAICARTPNDHPVGNRGAGWLHRLTNEKPPSRRATHRRQRPAAAPVHEPPVDWLSLQRQCLADLPSRDDLSRVLGCSQQALVRLGYGWHVGAGSWTFPMRDGEGHIIGLRTRYRDASKKAVLGSRNGIFVPDGLETSNLWLVEGPSEVAALLTVGIEAFGRPSNQAGLDQIVPYVRRLGLRQLVIGINNDRKGVDDLTWHGAEAVVKALPGVRCKIVSPPVCKDYRAWVNQGATAATLRSLEKNSGWT